MLRAILNILVRNASPRGHMCFRCLLFNLFYSLLDLRSSECDVVFLYVVCCSVNVSVCFVCCVFVNCLVKQFAMCLGVVAILFLNVMDVFSVCGGALLDRPCMVQSLQLLCILPFGMLCLSAISMMFVKHLLAVCMLVGMVV